MARRGHFFMKLLFSAFVALAPDNIFSSSNKEQAMTLEEFRDAMKNTAPFEVYVDGDESTSYFSGLTYVHYETTAFFGAENILSTSRLLYHTDIEFNIICGDKRAAVNSRRVRTYLGPNFEKNFSAGDSGRLMSRDEAIGEIFQSEGVKKVLLREYGLKKGTIYYAKFKQESYHLPPDRPGGKPQSRKNLVIEISDRTFPNTIEITPLYRGWSY